jgi:hypothetical protein
MPSRDVTLSLLPRIAGVFWLVDQGNAGGEFAKSLGGCISLVVVVGRAPRKVHA